MKKILIMLGMILTNITIINAESYPPKFQGPHIAMSAKTFKCGSFKITPLKPGITLESYLYEPQGSKLGTKGIIGKIEELEGPGRTIRYDSAGTHTQAHYRIYCKEKATGRSVVCEKAVKIESLFHNDKCQSDSTLGVGISTEEGYKDLNMNKSPL